MTTVTYSATASAIAWVASADRTIIVPAQGASLVRGVTASSSSILTAAARRSPEALDYNFDITARVAAGDAIADISVSIGPATLTLLSLSGRGTVATVWIGAAQTGQVSLLTIFITTRQGRFIKLLVTLTISGSPSIPGTITVVTVPQAYVDNAIATVTALAQQALNRALAAAAEIEDIAVIGKRGRGWYGLDQVGCHHLPGGDEGDVFCAAGYPESQVRRSYRVIQI